MYQEVCFNRGTEAGGGVNVGHSLSPSSHFMLATGLIKQEGLSQNKVNSSLVFTCNCKMGLLPVTAHIKACHLYYL